MKRCGIAFVGAVCLGFSCLGATGYNWKALDGDWSGDFTNVTHWASTPAAGVVPGTYDAEETCWDNNAQFDRYSASAPVDFTVTYPQGVYTNIAGTYVRFPSAQLSRILFDGRGTTLVYPYPKTNDHKVGNYGLQIEGYQGGSPTLFRYDFNGQGINGDLFKFTDFRWCVTNEVDEMRMQFLSGDFQFLNGAYTQPFRGGSNCKTRSLQVDKDATVTFAATLAMFTGSTNQFLRAKGGTLVMKSQIWSLGRYFGTATSAAYDRLLEFSATEGGTISYGHNNSAFVLGLDPTWNAGDSSSTTVRLLADGGTITQPYSGYTTESQGPGPHEIVLKNDSTGTFGGWVALGKVAGAKGLVAVSDSTATFERGIHLGGTSAAAVTGGGTGSFVATDNAIVTLGTQNDGYGKSCGILLYNGSVALTNATVTLVKPTACLKGDATYGGTRTFTADGATVVAPTGASVSPIQGFDTATVGAGGLTINTPSATTISQAFSGPGALTLAGAGKKTVTGDIACAKVVIAEGEVVFTGVVTAEVVATNGAKVAFSGCAAEAAALRGLTLGNRAAQTCGYLTVLPNETVWVDGPVDIQALRVTIGGTPASGDTFAIACKQGVSAAVKAEWCKMLVAAGLPAETSWSVTEEALTGDGVKLVATLGAMKHIALATDTHTTNIVYGAGEELDVAPAIDERTDLSGDLGYGKFVKTGGGAAYLSGDNEFLAGFVLNGGLLSFVNGGSLKDSWETQPSKICDGTLEFQSPTTLEQQLEVNSSVADNGLVVFKTEADVTMPAPKMTRGAFVKRGKGRLTFEVASNQSWAGLKMGSGSSDPKMVFDDTNGTAPATTTLYGAVNVAEGELVLRGVGETVPTVSWGNSDTSHQTIIGTDSTPVPTDPAQPGLVLDHVNYYPVLGHAGGGYETYVSRSLTAVAAETTFLTAPYLYITNGASMRVNGMGMTYGNRDDKVSANLLLDNGTLTCFYEFNLAANYYEKEKHSTTNTIVMRNGSGLYANYDRGRLHLYGVRPRFDVDHSTIARNTNRDPLGMFFNDRPGSGADMTFRNGAFFGCYMIGMNGDMAGSVPYSQTSSYPYYPIHMTFDDSEWYVGTGTRDMPSSNMNVRVTATGKGLKLNPPENAAWRLYTRVDGDAGIVKGGAGTLFIDNWFRYHKYESDPVTLACTGTNFVTGGTLRFKPTAVAVNPKFFFAGVGGTLELDAAASAVANVTVSGTGTLGAGTWQGLTVVPQFGKVLTVDGANGAALAGRTVFDFGGNADEAQKFLGAPVAVAAWTGDQPDVTQWRTRNAGLRGKLVFAAADGTVTAQMKQYGLTVIVR